MRQVMPHRNNMCMHRSKGKSFLRRIAVFPRRCGDFATRIATPQI